jgi:hypothetical protein
MMMMMIRPETKEKLFNLRHSSARNVIERIFGVVQKKFKVGGPIVRLMRFDYAL